MTRVLIPTVLRPHCDGNRVVEVEGASVGEAIANLTIKFPALREQLLEEGGTLRNYINVFVNDENIRDHESERTRVHARDEILIVPALAGG